LEIARGLWEETHPQLASVNRAPPTAPGSAAASQTDGRSGEAEVKEATEAEAPPVDAPPSQR
jgi:hypothetical protein